MSHLTPEEHDWCIRLVAQFYEVPYSVVGELPWRVFIQLLENALDKAVNPITVTTNDD